MTTPTTDTKASPRLYAKYQRYARVGRLRHGAQKVAFLVAEATHLSSTFAALFGFLRTNTAFKIFSQVSNTTGLTAAYTAGTARATPGGDASDSTTN